MLQCILDTSGHGHLYAKLQQFHVQQPGRGVGSENGFGEVLELVDHLGRALGASRVVTGLGWRPHSEQVGQTGSRITPDVYIACGISGAIQHMAGIEGAKTLIAINTDEESTMV